MMRPWRDPGVGATRSGAKEPEEDPEVEAEPTRCSAGASAWRRGVAAAARVLLRAEQVAAGRRLGFASRRLGMGG